MSIGYALAIATISVSASSEFVGVEFKAGRPLIGESLEDALKEPFALGERALEEDAQVLKEMPDARVKIEGFTDNQECSGPDCYELSLQRANLVYEWFLVHGVPVKNLEKPRGRGNEMAIGNNDTDVGRQRNRRTEVYLIAPRD
jgi:flagellar motor protein MotB